MKINLKILTQKRSTFTMIGVLLLSCMGSASDNTRKKVDELVASMSLKEKVQLLIGTGMHFELPDFILDNLPPGLGGEIDPNDPIYSEMVKSIRKYVPGAAGNSVRFDKLGITTQVLADGPAGLRIQPIRKGDENTYYCTAFPIATNLASTWDTKLVYNVGKAMGNEVLEYGVDVL